MKRKVKEILKLVAESPYYTLESRRTASPYMCCALVYSRNAGLISGEEMKLASKAIAKYLNKLSDTSIILSSALEDNDLPSDFDACLNIYLDWKNRPKPWKRNENCSDC